MKSSCHCASLLLTMWFLQFDSTVEADGPSATELVKRLYGPDPVTRLAAERGLIELKADAAYAIVRATCRLTEPREIVVNATLRILSEWDRRAWTDQQCAVAIEEFVTLARDPRSMSGEDVPLGPKARVPFSRHVRMLDVTSDAAAAYLRAKPGVRVSRDNNGFYRSVTFGSGWGVEPIDWLYVANLPCEIEGTPYTNGMRHPFSITVVGSIPSDQLQDCIRNLRKLVVSPLDFSFPQAQVTPDTLVLLQSFNELRSLSVGAGSEGITDEDWAGCVPKWPKAQTLQLAPNAGPLTVTAVSQLKELTSLMFANSSIVEADLAPRYVDTIR